MFTYHVFITQMGSHNLGPPPQLMTTMMSYRKLNLIIQSHIIHLLKQMTSKVQLVGKQIKSQQQPNHTHRRCFKCAFFQKIQHFQIFKHNEIIKKLLQSYIIKCNICNLFQQGHNTCYFGGTNLLYNFHFLQLIWIFLCSFSFTVFMPMIDMK